MPKIIASSGTAGFVPYTGATADVNLGGFDFILGEGGAIRINTGLDAFAAFINSELVDTIRLGQAGAGIAAILNLATLATSDKTFTFPNTSGTFALSSMPSNLDMNLFEILEFRVENLGSLPLGGNKGRLVYLTTDNNLYLDQG